MRPQIKLLGVVVAVAMLLLGACSSSSKRSSAPAPSADTRSSGSGFTFDQIPALVQRTAPQVVSVVTDSGVGSGIVWAADGTIVTNNHVIANASRISIAFADGKRASARTLGSDAYSDVAV